MTVQKLQAYSPRDMFAKVAKMISRQGVKVEFRGNQPRVETCIRTGKVIRMVLPELPDNVSKDLMEAMHGFLDHECAHILYTEFKKSSDWARIEPSKQKRRGMMANIVEDIRIERKLPDDLPGTKRNLERMYETFIPKYIDPATKKAIAQGTPSSCFAGVMVPAMRALSGQRQFQDYMEDNDYWQHFEPLITSYPELEADLKSMETYDDVLRISENILNAMEPEEDPEDDEDEGDDDQGGSPDDSKDEGESDESQQGDSDDAADEDEEPEGDDAEDETESDDGEGHGDGEGTDDGEEDEDRGDCSGDEDETNENEDSGDGPQDGQEDEGDADGDDSDEGDADGDDTEADGPESGDSGGDESDGEGAAGKGDEDEGGEDSDRDPEDASGSDGSGSDDGNRPHMPFEVEDSDLEDHAPDMDAMFEDIISDQIGGQGQSSWRPWTREYDELYEWDAPTTTDCSPIDHAVAKTTGPMMKEIRRLIAAQSQVRRMPGMRSGRLHGPNLHRIIAGDDRLFSRREEAQSLDTAITLLIDASGSMSQERYALANQSAYALASVLGKIGIQFECLAFADNNNHPEYPNILQEAIAEGQKNPHDRTAYRVSPLRMPVFKSFNETWRGNVQRRFAWVHNKGGSEPARGCDWGFTPEGDANEFAARRLLKRPEQRKILITMTDGQPGTSAVGSGKQSTFGPACKNFSRDMVKRIEAAGVDVIGVGIQHNGPASYYSNSIVVNELSELPVKILGTLKKLIINR